MVAPKVIHNAHLHDVVGVVILTHSLSPLLTAILQLTRKKGAQLTYSSPLCWCEFMEVLNTASLPLLRKRGIL